MIYPEVMAADLTGDALPAAERAYRHAKALIIGGTWGEGSLVSEGDLATRVGLSRTPVREAFLRLQGEGLLDLIPKRGAVVVPLPASEAEDVLDLREALECAAVRRITRYDDAELAGVAGGLRQCLRAQEEPARRVDLVAFVEADEAFHRAIVSASGNALAERFYQSLGDRQRRMAARALRPRPERLAVLVQEHTALVEAVGARDEVAFRRLLRAHLDATHREFHHLGGEA
ncbi:GntR family transcriptional regulator [Streptomyces sp. NPDC059740]|uniref:GntR family transcriptional regulator n=1 Tax=Streptomyces sp. NPDC059740 TaxID=3346926 RepID=UPI00365F3F14